MRAITIWTIIITVLFNTSCKKFLDVTADNQILQENMLGSSEGVRIAVNGVYKLMSSTDLYGQNLSWGFASVLGYNYDEASLPVDLADIAQFRWNTQLAQNVTEQLWKKSYNTLANCNNIIQEAEKKDSSFFIQKGVEKNMILGEMYGVRAMLHFDLLRIFSPAPSTGYSGATIPYVSAYPTYQPERLTMDAIFTRIINDMERARQLLGPIDTVLLQDLVKQPFGRIKEFTGKFELSQGDFFNYRAERMNYFGATALLARIYMYKGDHASASKYANNILNFHRNNWFNFTDAFNQGMVPDVDFIYAKRPSELLLSFANNNNYQNWDQTANPNQGMIHFSMSQSYMGELFQGDLDDFRLVGWYNRYGDQRYLTWSRPRGNSFFAEKVLRDQGPLLPVIRFTEMYHILAEAAIEDGRPQDAIDMLNSLRINRGAKTPIPDNAPLVALREILVKDIIRETLTEGQTFFMFKRLNRNIFNGPTERVMTNQDWYAPIPQSEIAYQL